MPRIVVDGAVLQCPFGTQTAVLSGLEGAACVEGRAVATVADMRPAQNIPAFGQCSSTMNPQVAAATASAQNVLTPQPCVPVVTAPWSPGAAHFGLEGVQAVHADSTCQCAWAGTIRVVDPHNATMETDT